MPDQIYRSTMPRRIKKQTGEVENIEAITSYRNFSSFPVSSRPRPVDLFGSGTGRYLYEWSETLVAESVRETPTDTYFEYLNTTGYHGHSPSWGALDSKTLLAIKDQSVNLPVFAAELGKTTDMMVQVAKDTMLFLRSLRRGDVKGVVNALKSPKTRGDRALASRWLEFQYGFVPLMYETYGLSELLYKQATGNDWVYGSATHNTQLDPRQEFGVTTGSLSCKQRAVFRFKVNSNGLRTMAASGITNPASVVWELIPYSFVIDWFVGIGDYLGTFDALQGVSTVQVIKSQRIRGSLQRKYSRSGATPIISACKYRQYDRRPPTSIITPSLPSFDPHITLKRGISALALVKMRLS